MTLCAPREIASAPSAPDPANRSRTCARSTKAPRIANSASRTLLRIGRTRRPSKTLTVSPRRLPPVIRVPVTLPTRLPRVLLGAVAPVKVRRCPVRAQFEFAVLGDCSQLKSNQRHSRSNVLFRMESRVEGCSGGLEMNRRLDRVQVLPRSRSLRDL